MQIESVNEAVAISVRLLALVHTIGLLHTHGNELAVGPSGDITATADCRLFNDSRTGWWTFVLTSIFVVYTLLEVLGVLRYPGNIDVPDVVWQFVSITLGSYFVMAIKPVEWFMSFEWTDCSSMYDSSMIGGRCATTAYVLIFGASICLLRDGATTLSNRSMIYGTCQSKLSPRAVFWLMHVLVPLPVLFVEMAVMWAMLKD